MKISVAAICRNESANVEQWLSQLSDVDQIIVVDTGSTDDTLDKLVEAESAYPQLELVSYSGPMAFDDVRNLSFSMVKEDHFCMWLDLDEQLSDGWLDELRLLDLSRIDGLYVDWVDGDLTVRQLKAVNPTVYDWKYTCHELLMFNQHEERSEVTAVAKFHVDHYPDRSKPRRYLPLLRESHAKYSDGRTAFYLVRELCFKVDDDPNYLDEAMLHTRNFGHSMGTDHMCYAYMHIAKAAISVCRWRIAEEYAEWSEVTRRDRPETHLVSAQVYRASGDVIGALHKSLRALACKPNVTNFVFDTFNLSQIQAADIASEMCKTLGMADKATFYKHLQESLNGDSSSESQSE